MAARDLARRSRRQLLWLLLGFVACQAVLAVAVERWLPAVRDPEYTAQWERLRARLDESPGRPLVLALGSSRTAFGLDASSLSASAEEPPALVFNFALMGGGPLLDLAVLRRLLAQGVRPDLLYVEVVPNMLVDRQGRLMEERLLDAARFQAGEVLHLCPHYAQPYRLLGTWGLGRALPCYRHQAELRGELALDVPSCGQAPTAMSAADGYGWHARPDGMSAEERARATRVACQQNADFCACSALAPGPVGALEELLALCRREGIAVTLLRMPEGSAFRSLYTPQARQALAELLARLHAQRGVALVDAQDWVEDDGFWDSHHLVAGAARRFTERFGREALRPTLAARSQASRAARP